MFTAGGGHARLSCRQGTDLWIDMVCKLVPFFMPWKHGYGSLQLTYEHDLQASKITPFIILRLI